MRPESVENRQVKHSPAETSKPGCFGISGLPAESPAALKLATRFMENTLDESIDPTISSRWSQLFLSQTVHNHLCLP